MGHRLRITKGTATCPRSFGAAISSGCPTVIEGKDDKEVMAKASEHAKNAHNMPTIPPDIATKVQKAIHGK